MSNEYTERPRFDAKTGEPIFYPDEQPIKENYTKIEVLFAWLALAAGIVFCKVFPVIEHPFGGMMFIIALFVSTAIVLKCNGASFGLMPILLAGSAILLIPSLFLSANPMIHFLVYLYSLAVWCYFVSGSCGNLLEGGFSDLLAADFLRALFALPFASFGKLFSALFFGRKKGGKTVLKILLGLALAIVPTAVVLALLSYDQGFVDLSQKLFRLEWGVFFSNIFAVLFGIPVGMYFYGLFYSAEKGKCAEVLTAEQCRRTSSAIKRIPVLTAFAATLPVLFVYGVFFASQWTYYTSAFTGVLPDAITFAEYARSGFFQLCAVSVINLMLIAVMLLFVHRSGEKPSLTVRILSVVFSVATLVLIATAFSKLYLYIRQFGLTPKRVYAGWFMGVLVAVFLLVIVKQLYLRFKLLPIATLTCVALFAVLALSGCDTRIAEYNVDRYLDGTLETVDVNAMYDLEDAAVPSMVRLGESLAEELGADLSAFHYDEYEGLYNEVCYYLYNKADREPYTVFSFTLPRVRADAALAEAGIQGDSFEGVGDDF